MRAARVALIVAGAVAVAAWGGYRYAMSRMEHAPAATADTASAGQTERKVLAKLRNRTIEHAIHIVIDCALGPDVGITEHRV